MPGWHYRGGPGARAAGSSPPAGLSSRAPRRGEGLGARLPVTRCCPAPLLLLNNHFHGWGRLRHGPAASHPGITTALSGPRGSLLPFPAPSLCPSPFFYLFFPPRSSSEMPRLARLELGTNLSPALPRPSHPIYRHIHGQKAGGSEWESRAAEKSRGRAKRGKGVGTNGGGRGKKKKKKKALSKKVLDVLRNAVSPLGKAISVRRSPPAARTPPAPVPHSLAPALPGAAARIRIGALPPLSLL